MHDDGEINDDEVLILYQANLHFNLQAGLLYLKYEKFKLDALRGDECEVHLRFKKADIIRLAAALQLPEKLTCSNGVIMQPVEALCIFLKRFSYPCRYADLVPRFGRPVSKICIITNLMVNSLHVYMATPHLYFLMSNLQLLKSIFIKTSSLFQTTAFLKATMSTKDSVPYLPHMI